MDTLKNIALCAVILTTFCLTLGHLMGGNWTLFGSVLIFVGVLMVLVAALFYAHDKLCDWLRIGKPPKIDKKCPK